MTPQEHKLVADLFDRLATLENAPRDETAVDAINAGLDRAPNALYPLVQTVLVQEEALKRADARIRELESRFAGAPGHEPAGGFLDNMRDSLLGRREPQGSVPSVRPGADTWGSAGNRSGTGREVPAQDAWTQPNRQPPFGRPAAQASAGGSFLGTAAATAAGVLGGALLMNTFRDMFGGEKGQTQGAFDRQAGDAAAQPWGSDARNSDLARDAGLNDVGGNDGHAAYDEGDRHGLFDVAQDVAQNDDGDDYDDGGFDADFGSIDV